MFKRYRNSNDLAIFQLVYVTFDDAFTALAEQTYYRPLFDGSLKNPDGCPIRATHFLSARSMDYSLVSVWTYVVSYFVTYSKDPNKRACMFIFFKKKNQPARSFLETARLFLFLLFLKILIFYLIKLTYLFNGCSFIWVPFYPAPNFLLYLPGGGARLFEGAVLLGSLE